MANFQADVIKQLLEAGWVADGETRTESVKFITVNSYPFAGAIAEFGGRPRFALPNTPYKVTVGKVSTYFYKKTLTIGQKPSLMNNYGTEAISHIKTKNVTEITNTIQLIDKWKHLMQMEGL